MAEVVNISVHEVVKTLKYARVITIHKDYEYEDYSGYGGLTKHTFKKSQLYKGKPETEQPSSRYKTKWAITYDKEIILNGGIDMSRNNVKIATRSCEIKKWLYGEYTGTIDGNKLKEGTISVNKSTVGTINNTTGVNNMTQRTSVTVELWDDSKGIEAQDSLVYSTKMITSDSDQAVIQQVLLEKNVKKHLESHNDYRTDMLNQDILERTGNEVYLQEVKLKNLRWSVKR